ncbi:conserved hypothetical protein [Flavobacterium sp. 9AF]|uniref:tetratricopeptide repeat protein n=1 Tax=Flavobacterium sp. 9AF TaxID=2653142 RepID=UPI0012F0478A|nr:tetratricopeptide repeat protein [Flavobacterium sp. 9AF]VXC13834.1 conserved hypothetical protein [Flavobacterium sp. 9AF]
MKKSTLLVLLFPIILFSQEYQSKFYALFKSKDSDKKEMEDLLSQWKTNSKNDIDYYIAAFNYYYTQSKQETLSLSSDAPAEEKESLQIKDSLNNVVGYLSSRETINDSLYKLSQKTIDEAIVLFPKRLDLRFGKIHTLGDLGDYETFSKNIIETIDYSIKINHSWLWAENKVLEDSENFFIDAIQRYSNTLYQNKSDENLKKVAGKMYNTFPNDIYVISTYGITFLLENKNKEALELYLKAEKINPEDPIVLNNIALIYERLENKKNAILYYNKLYDVGDEKTKAFAANKIKSLTE